MKTMHKDQPALRMVDTMKKLTFGILTTALLLVLSACSSAQLGYRFLDNLIRWELNEYVSLNSEQSRVIDAALDEFHVWHRNEQLPLYSAFIDQQVNILQRPTISTAQLQQAYNGGMLFWQASARRLIPDLAKLISTLDDDQLRRLGENMDKKDREFEQERILPPLAERKQKRRERMLESLNKWIGTPNAEQLRLVDAWVDELNAETAPRREQAGVMRQRFDDILKPDDPQQIQQQLAGLMLIPEKNWTPAYRQYLQYNRQTTFKFLVALHKTLTPTQKQKLLNKLTGYRRDFIQLSQR